MDYFPSEASLNNQTPPEQLTIVEGKSHSRQNCTAGNEGGKPALVVASFDRAVGELSRNG